MKSKLLIALLIILPALMVAQSNKNNELEEFRFLIDSDWETTGKWENGTPFEQIYSSEWGLNKSIIKIKMTGIINLETGEKGIRNEAIITYDKKLQGYKMYIFDVFGGTTISTISLDGNKIYFVYNYDNEGYKMKMRNTWIKKDENNFGLIIEAEENDKWGKILLNGNIKKIN